ncbi:MAG: heme exporter protein CcmD [Sphingomonadales bacterium]
MMGPEFWHMGGYAAFIWPAYGASILGLLGLAVLSYRKKKNLEKQVENLKAKKNG